MRAYLTLLLSLAAVWGASFMFIEIALDDLAPTTLMTGRLLVASVVLVSLMAARGILGRLKHEHGLAPLRVRGLAKVPLHADLTMFGSTVEGVSASASRPARGIVTLPDQTSDRTIGGRLGSCTQRDGLRW